MSVSTEFANTQMTVPVDLEPYTDRDALVGRIEQDDWLLAELKQWTDSPTQYPSYEGGPDCANEEVADKLQETYTSQELQSLENFLALHIPVKDHGGVIVDGVARTVKVVAATDTAAEGIGHGDMSRMVYLRDQIQVASAWIDCARQNPKEYAHEGAHGREILIGALDLMSTESQLARARDVIARGPEASQEEWPHISLHFNDLNATECNGWRNKQDTLQMLAYATLDVLERGELEVDDLAESHKQFLGSVMPLLKSVGYPRHENSGSWEEIEATRTSVMAVETALLHKMSQLITHDSKTYNFLRHGFDAAQTLQPEGIESEDFSETLATMLKDGLNELGQRLPNESPNYPKDSIKYREADAALTYVLRYDIPKLLASKRIPIKELGNQPGSEEDIENVVLERLQTLLEDENNGIKRYEDDSYLGTNFCTNARGLVIRALKQKVKADAGPDGTIDLDEKQRLRGEVIPNDGTALWTHPLGQIASWAAKRAREVALPQAAEYRNLSTYFLNAQLATITGKNQWHTVLGPDDTYVLRQVPSLKLPECYTTFKTADGTMLRAASSNTALNWSTATLKEALVNLQSAAKRHEAALN